jgi:enamine deaminase RidA (YjgF/YER057c/UK114 family)
VSERRRVSSGGPWEARYGYSRAIVAGDACYVSGTTDAGPDGRSRHPGDPAGQARAIFEIIEGALLDAGFGVAHIVRTRMFVTDRAHIEPVAEVQGQVLGEVRPASTAVVVAALIDPSLLVEIEVDARAWPSATNSGPRTSGEWRRPQRT